MSPQSKDLHKSLLNSLSGAVLWLNNEHEILFINSAAEALFEVSGTRILGQHLSALRLKANNKIEELARRASSGTIITEREAELDIASGHSVIVDCIVTPIIDNTDISLLVELQSVDRIVRINREENLLAVQETSKTLIRGLAHEIKNPLGGIRGAAQLLNRAHDDIGDYTTIIIEEVDRLRNLVDTMLGPNTEIELASASIHEVLDRVGQLIDAECGDQLVLSRDYDPSIPAFSIDKEQLIQATLNIARNAVQAMLENNIDLPRLIFKTRIIRQFTIGDKRHKLVCQVDIIDNGPGIPKHLTDKLFFPMVSGRAEGTGLGLPIAQSIVQRHKGLVEFFNETSGTRFTLYLPLEF